MSQKISNEELINELKRLTKELGKAPKRDELDKLGKYSKNAYKRAFGGISPALIKIGEKPTFYKNQTKEDLINEIKRIYKETGQIPTYTLFKEHGKFTYQTARNILNEMPWHLFLKECNLFSDEEIESVKRGSISKQELIDEVVRLKDILQKVPTYTDMMINGSISPEVYASQHETYSKAMIELGFPEHIPCGSYINSTPTKGLDGINYKSIFEANVANYLLNMKNKNLIKDYEYERVIYRKDCWRWSCDFIITLLDGMELFLECDGMGAKRKIPYNQGNPKIKFYIDNNINYHILDYGRDTLKDLDIIFDIYTIKENDNGRTNIATA